MAGARRDSGIWARGWQRVEEFGEILQQALEKSRGPESTEVLGGGHGARGLARGLASRSLMMMSSEDAARVQRPGRLGRHGHTRGHHMSAVKGIMLGPRR